MADGDGAANAQLKSVLRTAIEAKGWSQAHLRRKLELRGAALAQGTVSQALNPAKGPPGLDTLNKLIAVLGLGQADAEALRALRAAAAPSSEVPETLQNYLTAARRAAIAHPYPGVLPGSAPPPLSTVYLTQRTQQDDRPAGAALTTSEVVGSGGSAVIIAGPGGGKSSLLRAETVRATDRLLAGGGGVDVPVLVNAAELAVRLPLGEALAVATNTALSAHGLQADLPPELFLTRPASESQWLLLVDGLDEVTDAAARMRALTRLAAIVERGPKAPWRFVITTRPLEPGALDVLPKDRTSRFELLPFRSAELHAFASAWLASLGVPAEGRGVSDFMSRLQRSGVAELAKIPLMATMLCQLYAHDPVTGLPQRLSEIYRRFLELLQDRMYSDTSGGITTQAQKAVERFGPQAVERAHRLVAETPAVTARLAFEVQCRNSPSTLDTVLGWAEAQRPSCVPDLPWREFLRECLRRTGVIASDGDGLAFLHQTIQEYLAATYLAERPDLARRQIAVLLGDWRWSLPGSRFLSGISFSEGSTYSPNPEIPLFLGRVWHLPYQQKSFAGFLCDVLLPGAPGSVLERRILKIAKKGGLSGSDFLAHLVGRGVALPESVRTAAVAGAVRMLHRKDFDGRRRLRAASALVVLEDERGNQHLAATAADRQELAFLRMEAAGTLARQGHPDAAEALVELATLDDDPYRRLNAASYLTEIGDPRAADLIYEIAKSGELWYGRFLDTGERLLEMGDQRGQELVLRGLLHTSMPRKTRLRTLRVVGDFPGVDVAEYLVAAASAKTRSAQERLGAVQSLMLLGEPVVPEVVCVLLDEGRLSPYDTIKAAELLIHAGHSHGADVLDALFEGVDDFKQHHVSAGASLADCGDHRAIQRLVHVAKSERTAAWIRLQAIDLIAQHDQAEATALLTAFALDEGVTVDYRLKAASNARSLNPDAAHAIYSTFADNPSVMGAAPLPIARALAEMSDDRCVAMFRTISADRTQPKWLRKRAKGEMDSFVRKASR